MNIMLVSDVFGYTSALQRLADELQTDKIIDPYGGFDMGFKSEVDAYAHFIEQVGLNEYTAKLLAAIKASGKMNLIGFSVGASAIWRLSEKVTSEKIKSAIGYYGSQIRHCVELNPKFNVKLIFPQSEPHFDVAELQAKLSEKPQVTTAKVNCLHGFMNEQSQNFDQKAYQKQLKKLGACFLT